MRKLLVLVLLTISIMSAATVTVSDTLYNGLGQPANGSIFLSWPTFTASDSRVIPAGSKVVSVQNGILSVGLEPNAGSTPSGSYYTATYALIGGARNMQEYWVIPASGPVALAAIRTVPAPTLTFTILLSQLAAGGASDGQALCFTASTGHWGPGSCGGGGGGGGSFSAITTGTNSTAVMTVNTGASLVRTGSGIIDANKILGTAITAISGTGGIALFQTSPTIFTPVIASFTNATHTHQDGVGGGLLVEAALALTDITTNNANGSRHGFMPKGTGSATDCYLGNNTVASCPGGGANAALSNLASVSINTSLLAQTGVDLGSAAKPFRDLFLFGGGTYGTNYFHFTGTPTAVRTLTIPDLSGTFTLLGNTTTGSGAIVLGTSPTLGAPTISDFTNAQHAHTGASSGGLIPFALASPTLNHLVKGNGTSAALITGLTVDSSDNLSVPGSVSSGVGSGKSGAQGFTGATSGSAWFAARDVAGTAITYYIPNTNGTTGQFLYDTGVVACDANLPATAPAVCHALAWASFWVRTGNDMYNLNSGNVGIGAAPGNYGLDISKAGSTGTVRIQNATNTRVDIKGGASQTDLLLRVEDGVMQFITASVGKVQLGGGFGMSSDSLILFKNNVDVNAGAYDLGLMRSSVNKFCINQGGTDCTTKGDLELRNLSVNGTCTGCGGGGGSGGGGIMGYSGGSIAFSGTQYFAPVGGLAPSTTEANVDVEAPVSMTVGNFYVQLSAALGVGNTVVYTWRKAGADQTATCTITGVSQTNCSDTTHTFTLAAGDLFNVKSVTTGTVVATPNVVFTYSTGAFTLKGSAAIDFASITDGTCLSNTFTLTGATSGQAVAPAWPTALNANLFGTMLVSAADTVQVRLCNLSGAAIDPASMTFGASILP